MRWSPQKRHTLQRLDSVERSVVVLLRVVLWIALFGVLTLVIAAIVSRKPGGNTQGEYYYFGVAVLIALVWIIGQFARLRSRERQVDSRRSSDGEGSLGLTVRQSPVTGPVPLQGGAAFVRSWEFRFGSDPDMDAKAPRPATGEQFGFTRGFEIPLASLPADVVPDDAVLDAIAVGLERGESLEHLCEAVQPSYHHWSIHKRKAYRFLVEAKLEERRRRRYGSDA